MKICKDSVWRRKKKRKRKKLNRYGKSNSFAGNKIFINNTWNLTNKKSKNEKLKNRKKKGREKNEKKGVNKGQNRNTKRKEFNFWISIKSRFKSLLRNKMTKRKPLKILGSKGQNHLQLQNLPKLIQKMTSWRWCKSGTASRTDL